VTQTSRDKAQISSAKTEGFFWLTRTSPDNARTSSAEVDRLDGLSQTSPAGLGLTLDEPD
jgi:hypothetical protein